MPSLTELLRSLPEASYDSGQHGELEITHIAADSRAVKPGSLFIAIPGVKGDGAEYIDSAIEKGAVAILCHPSAQRDDTAFITHPNPRLALAKIAATFYPRQPACIVAVTGTDGKTSTAEFTRQLWELLGYKAASIGTLGIKGEEGEELYPGTHTTPDPVTLHRILQELHYKGYTHICMEASSHGLDQHRLDGVRLKAAAFTNLSRDHMDYHGSEEKYFVAKARLFGELLPEGAAAVINAEDKCAPKLFDTVVKQKLKGFIFAHTLKFAEQNVYVRSVKPLSHGQNTILSVTAKHKIWGNFGFRIQKNITLEIPLVGAFQVDNMLSATGLVFSSGKMKLEKILQLLPKLKGVPGRLEHVGTHPSGAPIYIDYAHTPAALEKLLTTLRPHTEKRLICVFGCGGDRDKGKRPQMGEVAARLADMAIITDDNPRSEDPAIIRSEVMAGISKHAQAKEIAGRKEAIYAALSQLQKGDLLVIAGKGHEKVQIIGSETFPFDDAEVVQEGLRTL